MTLVLKLGGSVITEKGDPETVDGAALAAAADAVADCKEALVVVHGGGSFGHYHADRHGVSVDAGTRDAAAAGDIHDAMARLDAAVVDALRERDVPALPVHPLSAAARSADGTLDMETGAVEALLGEGFVPVVQADVIAHAGKGATILSGDEIVATVAPAVDADRVGLCSTVPGVLDEDGDVIERVESLEAVAPALGGSDATDVTGGMAGKVRTLLDLAMPAQVFGADDLPAFLGGGTPGTTVDGSGGRVSGE